LGSKIWHFKNKIKRILCTVEYQTLRDTLLGTVRTSPDLLFTRNANMAKRRRGPSTVVTFHDDEGFIPTPVRHIVSAAGTTSVSVQQVMVPLSPQKEPAMPNAYIPSFDGSLGEGYDADVDNDDIGIAHYMKAPRGKRYPNAVCPISTFFVSSLINF
jgi:hypothetical protein